MFTHTKHQSGKVKVVAGSFLRLELRVLKGQRSQRLISTYTHLHNCHTNYVTMDEVIALFTKKVALYII